MGNHGFYVWFAYGLTFLIMGALAWHSLSAHGATRRALAAQHRRNAVAQNPAQPTPLGRVTSTQSSKPQPGETQPGKTKEDQ